MAGESPITSTATGPNLSVDREKFLAAKLLERSYMKLVATSVCEKISQPKGTGTTAYFVRYKRMNVPVVSLTEGVDPTDSTLSVEEVTATLDQWGDVLTITDVAQLTTKHPLFSIAMELLSDNAARVMDREVLNVWLSGTNVFYAGTATSRSTLAATDYISDGLLHKVRVFMGRNGAPPRDGPAQMSENAKGRSASGPLLGNAYVAICDPSVTADIINNSASGGLWVNVAQYQNKMGIYNAEVGSYLGFRFVESNFLPIFTLFGNTTAAVASGNAFGTGTPTVTAVDGGGSLTSATSYHYKAVRRDLQRGGFADCISIEHTTTSAATGDNESFTFAFPATAGYAYDLYFGSTAGDANLKLVQAGIAAGTTVTVTAVPTSSTTAPANVKSDGTVSQVHPVFVHGKGSCYWVGLQNLQFMTSKDEATTDNPLKLRRTLSYKFMAKAMLPDQNRLSRLEVAVKYNV